MFCIVFKLNFYFLVKFSNQQYAVSKLNLKVQNYFKYLNSISDEYWTPNKFIISTDKSQSKFELSSKILNSEIIFDQNLYKLPPRKSRTVHLPLYFFMETTTKDDERKHKSDITRSMMIK